MRIRSGDGLRTVCRRPLRLAVAVGLCVLTLCALQTRLLCGQQPALGYVYPPAIQQGTRATVQLGGYDFTSDMQFFVFDDDIALTVSGGPGEFLVPEPPYWFGPKAFSTAWPIPREIPAELTAANTAEPGLVYWQVANANGASSTAVLSVTREPVLLESRARPETIQSLPRLPVNVCGRISRIAEVDRYRIVPQSDGPLTLDVLARRLGADFHVALQVEDAEGARVADVADTRGDDPVLTFVAQRGQPYVVSLFDVDFRGNRAHVYQLRLRPGPRTVATLPAVVPTGQTRDVTVLQDVGTDELVKEQRRVTAASQTDGVVEPAKMPGVVASQKPLTETECPTDADGHRVLASPCAVTGILDELPREDHYAFTAQKGEVWRVDLAARAIGSPLDVALDLLDADGAVLASSDDLPGTTDAGLDFTAAADGRYVLVVRDASGGRFDGASHASVAGAAVYCLSLSHPRADFLLSVEQRLSVPLDGQGTLTVKARRTGGFQGEITLRVEGLPEGVTVPLDVKVPEGKDSVNVPLEVSPQAGTQAAVLRIVGTASMNGQVIEREATASAGGNLCPRSPDENRLNRVLLAITMPAPVTLSLVDKNRQRAVHRGTTYPAPFVIERAEGFDGDVVLQMAARQSRHRQGIRGPILRVPAGQREVAYPCFMPEWLATDRTTRMSVVAVVDVPDPLGKVRSLMVPADARVTMILEGALLKLGHEAVELTVPVGTTFQIPVRIARSAKLPQPVVVSLENSESWQGALRAEPVTVPPGKTDSELTITTQAVSELVGDRSLTLRAVALQDGRWPVLSQTEVPVRFVQP